MEVKVTSSNPGTETKQNDVGSPIGEHSEYYLEGLAGIL